MKKNILTIASISLILGLASCSKDLNRLPANSIFTDSVYHSVTGYQQALANVYGGYAVTGSSGPGSSDIAGVDAGTSDFFRCLWNFPRLSTARPPCACGHPCMPPFPT